MKRPERKQSQKIRLELSPQAEKYARRDAPRDVRLMAARGALPLPPTELATVLFALMHDEDAEVKSTARDSLENLPEGVIDAVLAAPAHPALLDHLAHAFAESESRLQRIALNAASSDLTVAYLAARPFRSVVEIVANNQQRLVRSPAIVEALGANRLTGRSVIERILAFLGVPVPASDEDDEEAPPPIPVEEVSEEEARAALEVVLGNSFAALVEEHEEEIDPKELEQGGSLYSLIQNLSVFQKIKLGRMGNKEARSLLVRDRNKIVAIAAVSSPKITEQELLSIAQSRAVGDEVIRVICRNKDVLRNYQMKVALATNPKTPQVNAMKFINYLQDKDLQKLVKSKDVPTVISTHARRILTRKGKM
jgi:hypothetical protein